MVPTVLLTLVPLVVVALLLAAFFKWELPRQLRWYADTGLPEWREKARQLPWRNRYALYRANAGGKAVERRLAALAVERGTVALRTTARMEERGSGWRRSRILVIAISGVNLVLNALLVRKGAGTPAWLMVAISFLLIVLWAIHPVFLRRATRRVGESFRLNQAILDEHPH